MNIQMIAAGAGIAARGQRRRTMLYHGALGRRRARRDKNNTSVLLCGIVKLHPLQPPHTLSKTNKEET